MQERLSVNRWIPPWVRHEHLARYDWAAPICQGRRVIDVACGSGYGAEFLGKSGASRVDGFDASVEAIEEANRCHAHPAVSFQVGDALHLPVSDQTYDVFVSFETIEHIADDEQFVREAARVLRPEGILLCSTPNRDVTNAGIRIWDRPMNPHHVREYTRQELEAKLQTHFSQIEWLGQTWYRKGYVRMLSRFGRVVPRGACRLHQIRKCLTWPLERRAWHCPESYRENREPEVLIAVCRR